MKKNNDFYMRMRKQYMDDCTHLEYFCMFIGYPRSGHSIIGALLDAHPNIIIAHELNILSHIKGGLNKDELYYFMLENSRLFAEIKRKWSGNSYLVPNQWNGTYSTLKVIGDKKGGKSGALLFHNPKLLDLLKNTIDIPQKFIHVYRNPYDGISTMSKVDNITLSQAMKKYFLRANSSKNIKLGIPQENWIDIKQESFIENPKDWLTHLCDFLGQEASEEYKTDCAQIVYKSPNKSRFNAVWTDELIQEVDSEMKNYDFLCEYSYND